jgi:hypothetical protein
VPKILALRRDGIKHDLHYAEANISGIPRGHERLDVNCKERWDKHELTQFMIRDRQNHSIILGSGLNLNMHSACYIPFVTGAAKVVRRFLV